VGRRRRRGWAPLSLAVDVRAEFVASGAVPFTVDVDLAVPSGETMVLLGPSGSGKTLVLETVAGYHPHEGRVRRDGADITDRPPEARGFGFVFQDYALFPHRTVRENVAFGLRYHEDGRDPDAVLARLGVADLADRYPETLSGGERQRVALARALAIRPAALLLDEPLSALDPPTRRSLRADVADVLADVTALYVTHDRTTARVLADRVAVVADGRIVQSGPPAAVFESPASAFVARFTGANVLVRGGETVAIRPEHVVLSPPDPDVAARVERVVREDAVHRVSLAVGDDVVDAFAADPPAVGDRVGVSLPPARVTVLDGRDGRRGAR
jgi:ABC-type Fe3+/spermidine/putrescine transport system ATPase subunit